MIGKHSCGEGVSIPAVLAGLFLFLLLCGCGNDAGEGSYQEPEPFSAVYVFLPGSNKISVISRDGLEEVSEINLEAGPVDGALVNEGLDLYVYLDNGKISVIGTIYVYEITRIDDLLFDCGFYATDLANAVFAPLSGGRSLARIDTNIHSVAAITYFSSATDSIFLEETDRYAFCQIDGKNKVEIYDTVTSRRLGSIISRFNAQLSARDTSSDYFFALHDERAYIDVISVSKLGLLARFNLAGLPASSAVFSSSDYEALAITIPESKLITVYELATLMKVGDLPCPFTPEKVYPLDDNGLLAVVGTQGEVGFFDPFKSTTMLVSIDVGEGTPVLKKDRRGERLVAVDSEGMVSLIDTGSKSLMDRLEVGEPAGEDSIVLDESMGRLFVGKKDYSALVVIDMETFKKMTEIFLESEPGKIMLVP